MSVEQRLSELGITIPSAPKPVGAYVPAVVTGSLAFASGQANNEDGKPTITGKLGREISLEQGYDAARLAMINCLAELKAVLGTLDRVKRAVKVTGYVASAEGFVDQPKVINGASELLLEIWGEAGKHARAAIGIAEVPGGCPVEVELIVELQ
jgi:enamine deaminase RidA (YjgF/YER057c/UK114 family)